MSLAAGVMNRSPAILNDGYNPKLFHETSINYFVTRFYVALMLGQDLHDIDTAIMTCHMNRPPALLQRNMMLQPKARNPSSQHYLITSLYVTFAVKQQFHNIYMTISASIMYRPTIILHTSFNDTPTLGNKSNFIPNFQAAFHPQ